MTIRTARLTLRPVTSDHASALQALWSQPDVRRYLWDGVAPSIESVRDIVRISAEDWHEGCGLWILERNAAAGTVGFCGFRAATWEDSVELVYGLAPDAWRRGLATEAARAALAFVFDRRMLDRVVAAVDVPNERSVRVLRRVGFNRERVGLLDGRDTLFFSLEAARFARVQEGTALDRVVLLTGDLVEQSVDAIVNAANPALEPGGGVCGAIHRAAGAGLAAECRRLSPCPVGSARITAGHRLRAAHVIHAVGPVYRGGTAGEADDLASAYRESLRLAAEHGLATVAFPAISTGIYGYPRGQAAAVALRTIREWTECERLPEEVRVVLFTEADREVWVEEWARQREDTWGRVRTEVPDDREAVYAVNAAAFDTDGEARLVDRLREEETGAVSLVAESRDGQVVGHVLFSPVSPGGSGGSPWMGLGPVAVHPEHQGRGIGGALIRRGLRDCRERRVAAVVVLGDPAYYARFGFVTGARFGIRCEYDVPDGAFQVLELTAGALRGAAGTVRYAEAFASLEDPGSDGGEAA